MSAATICTALNPLDTCRSAVTRVVRGTAEPVGGSGTVDTTVVFGNGGIGKPLPPVHAASSIPASKPANTPWTGPAPRRVATSSTLRPRPARPARRDHRFDGHHRDD
jgi:hypothetical protein